MNVICRSVLTFLFVWSMSLTVQAAEKFHISFQLDDVAANGVITRQLILNVLNLSGSDAVDAVAWIEGSNGITFDSRKFPLGDLPNGRDKGVTFSLTVPDSLKSDVAGGDMVVWNVETTNAAGERELTLVSAPAQVQGGTP